MGKRDVTIKRTFDAATETVTHDAGAAGKRSYDLRKLPATIRTIMLGHGGLAKLGDMMAKSAGTTVAAKFADVDSGWAVLLSGSWNQKREAMTDAQKFAAMKEATIAAWVSLKSGRTVGEFSGWLTRNIEASKKRQAALGNKDFAPTEESAIRDLSNNPEIRAAIAKMQAPAAGDANVTFADLT